MMRSAPISIMFLVRILLLTIFLTSCSEHKPGLKPLASDAVILAYGDSLTFGLGANHNTQSYPAVLQKLTGLPVVNAGISGEISEQGLSRLPSVLESVQPDLVILCHGGNDLIRRLGKEKLKQNLDQMIQLIEQSGAEVVVIAVPNFNIRFNVPDLYSDLAVKYSLPIDLKLLIDLNADPAMKSDDIHPNAVGYSKMARSVQTLLLVAGAL